MIKTFKKDSPLRCKIEGNELVVRIGIDTLAFAAENMPELFDQKYQIKVCNKKEFAKDAAGELLSEEEDGSSILSDALDKASMAAWENGSFGCHD